MAKNNFFKKILLSLVSMFMTLSVLPSGLNILEVDAEEANVDVTMTNRETLFNSDWKFSLQEGFEDARSESFDDSGWQSLTLPHDWSIYFDFDSNSPAQNEGGLLNGGTGWYRKKFTFNEDLESDRVRIHFGGVYMDSTVFVNGKEVGNYPNGYTPFSYDITEYLNKTGEENTIAVRAVNRQPSSRWYSGSGIYRDVHLTITNEVHVSEYGNYFLTPNLKVEKDGDVTITTETNIVGNGSEVQLQYHLVDMNNNIISSSTPTDKEIIEAESLIKSSFKVNKPKLWSVDNPNMYKIKTDVLVDNEVVDTTYDRFGFRYMEWTATEGFRLNGEFMKFQGVSMHHDQGALGAVANYDAIYRQMRILKDMGVNSIRVTHNPADDKLITIAEDLGLMVIDEAFDTWYGGKKTYDYGRFFEKAATHPDAEKGQTWAEFDLKQMVHRGKNSPAIIMWSVGNEIGESNSGAAKPVQTIKNLNKWVKEVDATRYTTLGQDVYRWAASGGHENISAEVDAVGLNYAEDNYAAIRAKHPDWLIYGAETASATTSRGVYAFPDEDLSHSNGANRKFQQSDYGNDHVSWGKTATNAYIPDRDNIGYAGQFVWTGFDYIGEPTPWHNQNSTPPKSSYFGIVDTAGFPKNSYYLYQSQWLDVKDNPMVHIFPHWNWESEELLDYNMRTRDGKIPLRIYSNAPKVELLLNGESLGEKAFTQKVTDYGAKYQEGANNKELYLEWRLDFIPGELTAIAKDESGNEIARDVVTTSNGGAQIELLPEKRVIKSNNYDLSYVEVNVVDEHGVIDPNAQHNIDFEIVGDGIIVGVDNGNAASRERYKSQADGTWQRKVFNGKAIVIVQSTSNQGKFTLKATSSELSSADVNVYTTNQDPSEDVLGYDDVFLTTDIKVIPELPQTITAVLVNGDTKQVDVQWDELTEDMFSKVGSISVKGTVEESDIKVTAYINIREVSKILDVRLATGIGKEPELPSNLTLVYTNGQETTVDVVWKDYDKSLLNVEGTFIIDGTADYLEKSYEVKAYVSVLENVVETVNIAVSYGEYPKASSTHEPTGDKISNINDGIIDFGRRWTNWQNGIGAHETEEVVLEFEQKEYISSIGVHFFTDGATKEPRELIISTSNDGITYTEVNNQSQKSGFNVIQGDVETEYPITFDKVEAKFIKLTMSGQPVGANFRPIGLVELKVYADRSIFVADTEAKLTELKVGSYDIELVADKFTYTIDLNYSEKDSIISAKANDTAGLDIIEATKENNYTAKIIVTSQDGKTKNVYQIRYIISEPMVENVQLTLDKVKGKEDESVGYEIIATLEDGSILDSSDYEVTFDFEPEKGLKKNDNKIDLYDAGDYMITANITYKGSTLSSNTVEITVEKNMVEKEVISIYDTHVSTDINTSPLLPETVKVKYDSGFDRELAVVWDHIDEELLSKYGEFIIEGTVDESDIKAKAIITVEGIKVVERFSVSTPLNKTPELPVFAKAYRSDNTSLEFNVQWDDIDPEDLSKNHTFELEGLLVGTNVKTTISIRVSSDTKDGNNIAQMWTGSDLPAGIASYTNDGPGSNDRVALVNDTIISYNDSPANRWTNWNRTSRTGDWVGILFADAGSISKRFVDNFNVAFFSDSGTSSPDSYTIEYFVGDKAPQLPNNFNHVAMDLETELSDDSNWKEVTNIKAEDLEIGKFNEMTFDGVETYAIRINMKAKTGISLAITEIEVYDRITESYADYETTFYVDGEQDSSISEGVVNTMNLRNHNLPNITVETTNNAASTIIYDTVDNQSVKIIVRAEDGIKVSETTINFNYDIADSLANLYEVIMEAKMIDSMNYTTVSYEALMDALNKAELVYDDVTSNLEEINATIQSIQTAIESLVKLDEEHVEAKKDLITLIHFAERMLDGDYTLESLKRLAKVIEEATLVYEDNNSTTEDYLNAIDALNNAIDNLEKLTPDVDEEFLKEFIETLKNAEDVNQELYTEESLLQFNEAFKEAKDIKRRLDEGEIIDDVLIVSVTKKLKEAINNLVKITDSDTDNSEEPLDPEKPVAPEKPGQPDKDENVPPTGVMNNSFFYTMVIASIIGLLVLLKKKKYN